MTDQFVPPHRPSASRGPPPPQQQVADGDEFYADAPAPPPPVRKVPPARNGAARATLPPPPPPVDMVDASQVDENGDALTDSYTDSPAPPPLPPPPPSRVPAARRPPASSASSAHRRPPVADPYAQDDGGTDNGEMPAPIPPPARQSAAAVKATAASGEAAPESDELDDEAIKAKNSAFKKAFKASTVRGEQLDTESLYANAREADELKDIKPEHLFLQPRGKLPKAKEGASQRKKNVFRYFVNFSYYRNELPAEVIQETLPNGDVTNRLPLPPPPAVERKVLKDGRQLAVLLKEIEPKWEWPKTEDKSRDNFLSFEVTGRISRNGSPRSDKLGRLMIGIDLMSIEDVRNCARIDKRFKSEMLSKLAYMDNMRFVIPKGNASNTRNLLAARKGVKPPGAGDKKQPAATAEAPANVDEPMLFLFNESTVYRSIVKLGKVIGTGADDMDPYDVIMDEANWNAVDRWPDRISAEIRFREEGGKKVPQVVCMDEADRALDPMEDLKDGNLVALTFMSPYLTYNETEYGPSKQCTRVTRLDQEGIQSTGRGLYSIKPRARNRGDATSTASSSSSAGAAGSVGKSFAADTHIPAPAVTVGGRGTKRPVPPAAVASQVPPSTEAPEQDDVPAEPVPKKLRRADNTPVTTAMAAGRVPTTYVPPKRMAVAPLPSAPVAADTQDEYAEYDAAAAPPPPSLPPSNSVPRPAVSATATKPVAKPPPARSAAPAATANSLAGKQDWANRMNATLAAQRQAQQQQVYE